MEENPKELRHHVMDRWASFYSDFSPIKDKFFKIKVVPLWHGSTRQKVTSIAQTNFTYFGKHHYFNSSAQEGVVTSTDEGYFGSGIYFTNSAEYAAKYSSGHLILSWVSMRDPYPVVRDIVDRSLECADMKKLKGYGAYQNYNAHYIPVVPLIPNDNETMIYIPCAKDETAVWDEIVVFQPSQVLPRFWIELSCDSPTMIQPSKVVSQNRYEASRKGDLHFLKAEFEKVSFWNKSKWLNELDTQGNSLLHLATWHQQTDVVYWLIQQGAKLDIVAKDLPQNDDYYGYQPIHLAAKKGYAQIVSLLLDAKKSLISERGRFGRTPLHMAAHNRQEQVVLLLKSLGADLNMKSSGEDNSVTPLHEAVFREAEKVVEILLQSPKINPNLHDQHGHTPLYYAVINGHVPIAHQIIQSKTWNWPQNEEDPNHLLQLIGLTQKHKIVQMEQFLKQFLST
jgi:hypothetical protein